MEKKGQLYLLTALLIGLILFILLSPTNVIKRTVAESRFEETSKNFEIESAKFINYLIKNNKDVETSFLNFTILFTSYSKTKNPDFGLIYAFIYDKTLYMGNYLDDTVNFYFESSTYGLIGCFSDVNTTFSIAGLNINIHNIDLANFLHCQTTASVLGSDPYMLDIDVLEPNNPSSFTVELAEGHPELVIVTKEKKGETRKVYTKGKFI